MSTFSASIGRAGIAGATKHAIDTRTLADFPRQRMFATAIADDQDIHVYSSLHMTAWPDRI